ncbi:MAG: hypothetical protein ACOX15_03000 [Tepidanaerobacteraceae bacterium]
MEITVAKDEPITELKQLIPSSHGIYASFSYNFSERMASGNGIPIINPKGNNIAKATIKRFHS